MGKSAVFMLLFACLSVLGTACGGSQKSASSDPISLLRQGRYDEAIAAAQGSRQGNPGNEGLIALATLARKPTTATAKAVAADLYGNTDVRHVALAAVAMLETAAEIPTPPATDFDLQLCETALGAVGYGRYAAGPPRADLELSLSQTLAIAVLERLSIQVTAVVREELPEKRLIDIWNGSYSLLGGRLQMASEYKVWRLFVCLSELSISLWNEQKRDAFSSALVETAISTIESNPTLGPAVRCDLASPYERLRTTIAGRRDLMGDLERAVAIAVGCTRGQYAPLPDSP